MKLLKQIAVMAAAAAFCLLTACGNGIDAGVLIREAKTDTSAMKSCHVSAKNTLTFTAGSSGHSFESSAVLDYHSAPFAVKSVQSSKNDGVSENTESYTVTENGGLSFYCKSSTGWQKTGAENLNTSPSAQIDILRLLDETEDQKYVRETEINLKKVRKIELKLKSEVLRSTVENIVTASGMSSGSTTIVQTLLDSAPAIYGYCYLDESTGKPVRLELDAAEAVNKIFQGIDGSTVKITVSKCLISGDLSQIDSAPDVTLPDEAKRASSVQAKG